MIYVGIDVAKDKHDCFITNSDGEVLFKSFTISNNREGFKTLFQRIGSVSDDLTKAKVGLEATGRSRGLGDVYKRQVQSGSMQVLIIPHFIETARK